MDLEADPQANPKAAPAPGGPVAAGLYARGRALGAQVLARVLGRGGPLVLSRLASAALTFALPLVLVRLLQPEAFGTYKQFFLVAQTVLLVGQLGITQSLFYFLPRGGAERGAYVGQAVASLAALGALAGLGLWLLAPVVGHAMGSAELGRLGAPLGLFAGLMLAAAPLEGALTAEGRLGLAALAYVLSDGARAAALVAAAFSVHRFGPTVIFWAAAAVAGLRGLALALLLVRRTLPLGWPRAALFRGQLAFALPFAGAILLYVAQRTSAQYVVSARFDAATFALFTVASFHLPVIDIVFTPLSEVMMVQLGRTLGPSGDRASALAAWDDTVDKLASLLFPAAACAWLFGPQVLPLLFTHRYAGAVPLFLLTTVEIPLWILPVDALLRAAGDTRFLFAFNGARVLLTTGLVLGGISALGLPGAILGGLLSEAVTRVVMIARGARFLDAGLARVLAPRGTGRVALAALLACAPAALLRLWLPGRLRPIIAGGLVYGLAYLAARALLLRRPDQEEAEVAASSVPS